MRDKGDVGRRLAGFSADRLVTAAGPGGGRPVPGLAIPEVTLAASDGSDISLAGLTGQETVVYAYPLTGRPGAPLPEGWDDIRGHAAAPRKTCAFRDHYAELRAGAGADRVFGLSTQDSNYQREAAERLHLPFPLLSDAALAPDDRAETSRHAGRRCHAG